MAPGGAAGSVWMCVADGFITGVAHPYDKAAHTVSNKALVLMMLNRDLPSLGIRLEQYKVVT